MLSIDYNTNIIFVPQTYTQFVGNDLQTGTEVRQLNLTVFAQDLANLQDDPEGVWASTAFNYTAPVSVGGVQLAPVVVILEPYRVEFEDNQYAVNLVGANTNVQDVSIVNQVSIRPNNSAGLTFSDEVQLQAFQDASVWIDTLDGLAGTQYPRGTTGDRVNNPLDAISIALRIGFNRFHLEGNTTFTGIPSVQRYEVIGNNPTSAIVTGNNLGVEGASFIKCGIIGSITGRGSFQDCSIGKTLGLTGVQGIFDNCGIAGNLTLDNNATEPIIFKDCISAIAGSAKPMLDCNGTTVGINFRRYAGGLKISNFNDPSGTMTLDLMGAEIQIESSCTNGDLVVRGVGKVIDQNGNVLPYGTNTINGNLTLKNDSISEENVTGGGGVWSISEKNAILTLVNELHNIRGLDSNDPVVHTPTGIASSLITLDLSGDGENITTVTRQ